MSETVSVVVPEPHYSVLNTTRGDLPAVLVVNNALLDPSLRAAFSWSLSVVIEFVARADKGMPDLAQRMVLDRIDEMIEGELAVCVESHGSQNVLFGSRSTWNGTRELKFQVNDPERADRILRELVERTSEMPWSYRMQHDPEWQGLAEEHRALASARS